MLLLTPNQQYQSTEGIAGCILTGGHFGLRIITLASASGVWSQPQAFNISKY